MIVRTLSSLLIVIAVIVAAHLARPVGFASMTLAPDGTVEAMEFLDENSAIQIGDRIIAINDQPYMGTQNLRQRISPWDTQADVRVVSLQNARKETLKSTQLHQELPEILQPTFYVLQIDDRIAYGETASTVAQVLRERDEVQILAVPTLDVEDRLLDVSRGWPPLLALIAIGVAMLAVLILWAGAPLLGITLGLFAAGAALWLDVSYPIARILGVVFIATGVATGAWLFLRNGGIGERAAGQKALRKEGKDADSDLVLALQEAEESIGSRLYIIVGSSSQAVEIIRDYERIVVEEADSILTSTLSMLATEGGVFPRMDTGEDVRDPWGDPLQDLDKSVDLAAAVPLVGYGRGQDRWAFVIARTWDATSSAALLEQIAEVVSDWERTGVREAISVHATHGLFQIVRTSGGGASSEAQRHGVTTSPETPLHSNLDHVSEGVGIPRVVSRQELDKERETPKTRPPEALDTPSIPAPRRATPPSSTNLAHVSEGIGVPRTVRREDLAREKKAMQTPSKARANERTNRIPSARSSDTTNALRAWTGHLERRVRAAYPVDDPRCYSEADWRRLAPCMHDARPVIIFGEAGVGKEFAARAVHERSPRADQPITVIDCTELSESDVELELFGLRDEPGVLAGLAGGALCIKSPFMLSVSTLNSIADQADALGIRLFFLARQQGESLPLSKSASTQWLADKAEDRYVRIPPLREHPLDTVRAAQWMLQKYSVRYAGGQPRSFSPSAERWLRTQHWTANYWDLSACIRAAVLRTDDDVVSVSALQGEADAHDATRRAEAREDGERERLIAVLHRTEGNKAEAARILGLTPDALLRRLRRHGLM